MKLLNYLLLTIFLMGVQSCSTTQRQADSSLNTEIREPSSVNKCESLFRRRSVRFEQKNESRLNLVTEILPATTTEAFWDTLIQLGDGNSKIQLDSSSIVLTKVYDQNFKIHSTYTYDRETNNFVISKLHYSNGDFNRRLISDSPIDPVTNKLKTDLLVDVDINTSQDINISITDHISYKVYEKILGELPRLELFTTYELKKIYDLPKAQRTIKYNTLARARAIRKFFVSNILNDYLYAPVKYLAVSVVSISSVYLVSHINFLKSVSSKAVETPQWVAPSVVKMAVAYPKIVQPELVTLIKHIEYQEKSDQADAQSVQKLIRPQEIVKIDEADQFSIEVEEKTKKAYFFVSHLKENGKMEIYATLIDPKQYPNLINYFKIKTH